MDHEVVGSELADTYHELLTMEARLTLEQQATTEPGADRLSLAPAVRTIYHRQRTGSSGVSSHGQDDELAELADRLWIERPQGALPQDSRNPAPPGVERGSNVLHRASDLHKQCVGVRGRLRLSACVVTRLVTHPERNTDSPNARSPDDLFDLQPNLAGDAQRDHPHAVWFVHQAPAGAARPRPGGAPASARQFPGRSCRCTSSISS